ncbi:hypothetical protein GS501_04630 [Saccharibacter sp. 17.LH.SD]|uniref:hypothetical protein n=1 Tax=Saccharibacter sp. 17.LH.SD TaxID=2689393 RepID=UPI00136AB548|nr:hypothetical protein [Saccharibacter sp. 17.LH.SD]MXV44331.1 hypothetical protein [Saccharibacter sp. 17.LH.SD]
MASFTPDNNRAALNALTQRYQEGRRTAIRQDAADQEQLFEKALEELSKLKGLLEGAQTDHRYDSDDEPADHGAIAQEIVRIARETDKKTEPKHDATKERLPSSYIPGEPAPEQTTDTQAPSEKPSDTDGLAAALEKISAPRGKDDAQPASAKKTPDADEEEQDNFPYYLFMNQGDSPTMPAHDATLPQGVLTQVVNTMRENGCSDEAIARCITECGGNPDDYVHDSAENRDIRQRLDDMNRRDEEQRQELERLSRRTRPLTDDEHNEVSKSEAETDSVAQSLGLQTPRYIPGESVKGYQRRCAKLLQSHSADWKNTDLSKLPPEVFELASRQIHKDAQEAASRPMRYKDSDPIRPVTQRSPTGHTRTEYRGSFRSAFGAFMS